MVTQSVEIANAQLAENIIEAENEHDYDRLYSVIAQDVVLHRPKNVFGRAALRRIADEFYAAFPDHRRSIDRLIPGARFVVTQWRFTGTHRGEWCGFEPTGRRVGLTGCSIWEFENLRLVGSWCLADQSALVHQLALSNGGSNGGPNGAMTGGVNGDHRPAIVVA
jgi:predicted ester cyclase